MYDIFKKEKYKEEEKPEAKLFTTSLSKSIQNKEWSLVKCFMASSTLNYNFSSPISIVKDLE